MICPKCGSENIKVIYSTNGNKTNFVRRRRECIDCETRFNTAEVSVIDLNRVRNWVKGQPVSEGKEDILTILENMIPDTLKEG